jgi:hypothetical protein
MKWEQKPQNCAKMMLSRALVRPWGGMRGGWGGDGGKIATKIIFATQDI